MDPLRHPAANDPAVRWQDGRIVANRLGPSKTDSSTMNRRSCVCRTDDYSWLRENVTPIVLRTTSSPKTKDGSGRHRARRCSLATGPDAGVLQSGRLLVTYRNVEPAPDEEKLELGRNPGTLARGSGRPDRIGRRVKLLGRRRVRKSWRLWIQRMGTSTTKIIHLSPFVMTRSPISVARFRR